MTTSFAPQSVLPTPILVSGTDSVVLIAEHGMVQLPSTDTLITSMYSRAGHDLVIADPAGVKYIVKGFFNADPPPSLTDGHGLVISGEQAAQYTGPANVNVYAQAGGSTAGPQIGQIRTVNGDGTIIRADGTTVPLKVGTPLFAGDTIETGAGADAGVVLVDGTTLAVDAKAELVLDELVYDPGTHNGKESVSLLSGAASFVSGQIAKSGQDHMVFKTPVATIGIRGTKVFASYDPDTGDVTILNRPVPDASGHVSVGKIALFTPSGAFVGEITTPNTAWQFNPSKGETPTPKTFTEAQVSQIAGKVESLVTTLVQQQQQQQQQQQPQQQGPAQQQDHGPDNGQQGGAQGQGNGQHGEGGNQQGGDQDAKGGDKPADGGGHKPPPDAPAAPLIAPQGQSGFSPTGAAQGGNNNPFGAPQGSGPGQGSNPGGSLNSFTPPSPLPPANTPITQPKTTTTQQPIILPTQVVVSAVTDTVSRPGTAVFEIIRVNNLDQTTTVGYSTANGSAEAGSDYNAVSGSVTFGPGETSKTVTIAVLLGSRVNPTTETFSLGLSGSQSVVVGSAASVTLAPPPPLPTITIDNASVSVGDQTPGTVTLTLTRTGDTSLASTVNLKIGGTAQAGSDFIAPRSSVTFAAGETTKTVSISILANTTPLKFSNQEGAETITIQLTNPDGANLGTQTHSTITILADPVVGLATFNIGSASVSHGAGNTAVLTVTRGGDLVGEVSVNYTTSNGTAVDGTDFKGTSGKLTFAAGETSKTISVPIIAATGTTPARQFSVVLSGADGGDISQATGNVAVSAFTGLPTISISGTSVTAAAPTTAQVTISLSAPSSDVVSVNYSTSNGSAISGTHYSGGSGTVTFQPGETSKTISFSIPFVSANTTSVNFSVSLSSASNGVISSGSSSAVVTILGVPLPVGPNTSPVGGDAFLPAVSPGTTKPAGASVSSLFTGAFTDADGNILLGIAVVANTASSQGVWQFSSDNGTTWIPIGNASMAAPVAIAASSLIRFVPAAGFFGIPPQLEAYVIDSSFTGGFSSSASNFIATANNAGFGNGSALAATSSLISTAVLTPVSFAGSGNWTDASKWSGGAVPNAGQEADITGGSVSLANNGSNNVAALRIANTASLSISSTGTKLSAALFAEITPNASLNIGTGATFAADGVFKNSGTINVGNSGDGFLEGFGTLTNLGTINANRGAISININNSKNFVVQNTANLMNVGGNFTNLAAGTVRIQGSTTATEAAFTGLLTNLGKIQLTSTTSSQNVTLDFTGNGLLKNQGSSAVLQIDAGTGGSRTLSGNITNLAGTVSVNTNTTFQNGTFTNGDPSLTSQTSTIAVASNKVLTFGAGATFISDVSSTLVGSGAAASPTTPPGQLEFANGGNAALNANLTIPLGAAIGVQPTSTIAGSGTLTVNGNFSVIGGTSTVNVDLAPSGVFATGGDTVIGGSITSLGAFLVLAGPNLVSTGTVRLSGSLTNNSGGAVILLATNTTNPIPPSDIIFDVSAGSFINNGLFASSTGGATPSEGGGLRLVKGSFMNNGVFSVESDTTYAGGTLTNSGAVNVTAGRTLTIDAGATLFHSGGVYSGGTGVNNPSTNGKLIIGNNATFDWNASGTVNAGLNVQVGDTNGPGAVTGTGTITVNGGFGGTNGTIGAPIVVANGGTFGLGGNGTMTVSSTVTVNSGGIFAVAANQDSDANVKFTGAITNAGVAVLTMAGGITGPRNATIDLSLGSFTNSAGGLLLVPAGTPGGVREVVTPNAGPILNSGSIMIQTDTVFTGTNSVAISNQSGGTFTIQNGVSADFLGSGGFDNQSGATMTIDGFLNMHGNALVNAGEIKGSGTISMDGGTFDTSAGRSSIAPGNSPGHLTIDGNAVFGAGSHTVIELAGTAAGQFDTFTVTGHFTRGGVLDVVHYDGFAPQAGDSFHIMSWGSASGMFDAATGLADPGHGVALDPVFSDSGLTLMARPITLQGGSSDTTLSGTSGDDVMVGGSGHTIFNGGDGNDLMIGGTGDSRFLAGNGNDHIIGGTGENTVDFSYAARPVHVDLAEGTATTGAGDHDTIIGVQNVVGSTFADAIAGDAHNNVITGGAGADTLTGGGGANTFVYNVPSEGGDSITDFVSGKDIISILDQAFGDQSSIVDGQNFSTIQDTFNGSAAGNNAAFNAGKAAFVFSAHDSALYYDANGAGAGYTLVAHVEPGATVTAGDIHLFHGATT